MITASIYSFFLGLILCGLSFVGLRRFGIVDLPNERSSHSGARVRGGGLGIISTLILVTVGIGISNGYSNETWILVPILVLAAVSFVDDAVSLGWRIRLVIQVVCALCSLGLLSWPNLEIGIDKSISLGFFLSTAIWLSWLVGYTNAFNFMDGIDGLAGFQSLVCSLGAITLGTVAGVPTTHWSMLLSASLAGATLAFLPFNFPRAKMFMGDVGSASIGLLLAVVVVDLAVQVRGLMLLALALLHTNFILDTGITLVRRIFRGEKWHAAHRSHFYQRLQRSGRSHAFVTLIELAIQVIVAILAVFIIRENSIRSLFVFVFGVGLWLGFFLYCEQSFVRQQNNESSEQ